MSFNFSSHPKKTCHKHIIIMMQIFSISLCLVFIIIIFVLVRLLFCLWVLPLFLYRKLKWNGFSGPKPSFPFGNLSYMKMNSSSSSVMLSHNIHSTVFPYFAQWQKLYGKVFIYWLGTEPFLYVADPEFLKRMTSGINGKSWGKPTVFKRDREPMFGSGLLMVEGDDWVRHRHVITPAFSPLNLKNMASSMVDSATGILDRWSLLIHSGHPEIDVEKEIICTTGEIIANTSFGISYQKGRQVLEKLRSLQTILFKSKRFVGVPYANLLSPKQTIKAVKLGKEIDDLLFSIITQRLSKTSADEPKTDLLGLFIADNTTEGVKKRKLTTKELVDECKTFFFAGHDTTALLLIWTLLLLAIHPEWQEKLREEIAEVVGDGTMNIDATKLAGLKKMGWVMDEVLRLYPPAPNAQRQAREAIQVGNLVIPKSTNIWIDTVSMHHDPDLWGDDVNEFKPERFAHDIFGACNHKMGYLPFGFGGRMCVGRNLTKMEYKIVLTLILSRFSFSLSPTYRHAPSTMLTLGPMHGLPLIFKTIS